MPCWISACPVTGQSIYWSSLLSSEAAVAIKLSGDGIWRSWPYLTGIGAVYFPWLRGSLQCISPCVSPVRLWWTGEWRRQVMQSFCPYLLVHASIWYIRRRHAIVSTRDLSLSGLSPITLTYCPMRFCNPWSTNIGSCLHNLRLSVMLLFQMCVFILC